MIYGHYLMCIFGHCLIVVSIWSLPYCCIWSLLYIYHSGEYVVITTIAVFGHCLGLMTVVNIWSFPLLQYLVTA